MNVLLVVFLLFPNSLTYSPTVLPGVTFQINCLLLSSYLQTKFLGGPLTDNMEIPQPKLITNQCFARAGNRTGRQREDILVLILCKSQGA
jgi:hypothetical protein